MLSNQKATCLTVVYLLHYLNQFRVALQRTVQAVSATLPPLQGDKKTGTGTPMKTRLALSILFCAIALPALGELTDADLNEIRLIVREEVKKETTTINTKIDGLDTRLRTVETDVATIKGYQTGQKIGTETRISWIVALAAVIGLLVSFFSQMFKKDPQWESMSRFLYHVAKEAESEKTDTESEKTDTASVSP